MQHNSLVRGASKIAQKIDLRLMVKLVCDTVKKCNDCSRIITGKFIKNTNVVMANVTTVKSMLVIITSFI